MVIMHVTCNKLPLSALCVYEDHQMLPHYVKLIAIIMLRQHIDITGNDNCNYVCQMGCIGMMLALIECMKIPRCYHSMNCKLQLLCQDSVDIVI